MAAEEACAQLAMCAEQLPAAVVVAGGAGLLGRTLVRRWQAALEEGGEACPRPLVVSLDLKPNHEAQASIVADLSKPDVVERLLFHQFAVQSIIVAVKPPLVGPSYQDFLEVNVSGICDLARLAEQHGVRQLVYVSSIAACNHWVSHHNCSESDPSVSPPFAALRSPYDLSKALAEDFVLRRHRPDGLRAAAIRIAGVYGGVGDPYWHRRLPFGLSFDASVDCPTIDCNYVENVAEAMLRVARGLQRDASVGGRFYFYTVGDRRVNGQHLSILLAERLGQLHIPVPWSLLQPLLWSVRWLEALPLMLPSWPWRQPCGRAVRPKSFFTLLSMSDMGFIEQTFDNTLYRATFGFSHVYTVEESMDRMAAAADAATPGEAPTGAVDPCGVSGAASAVAAGLPLCLCFCAALVLGLCGGVDHSQSPTVQMLFPTKCPWDTLDEPEIRRLANACILLAVPVTHILGFATQPAYKLWQPFRGGTLHVMLQGVSWTMFSLMCMQWLLKVFQGASMRSATETGGLWHTLQGVLDTDDRSKAVSGVFSQILLGLSLFAFKGQMREKSS